MGLGGITRDSIVGLNNLVKDDNDDEPLPRLGNRRTSMDDKLSGSWNNGSDKNTNFQALLEGSGGNNNNGELQHHTHPPPKLDSLGSFREPLNDSPATPSMATSSQIHQQQLIVENRHRPPSPPRLTTPSSATATAATSVSSTNSRSLDSYRNDNLKNQYYQGFQYEGYADYYSEDYASYSFDESSSVRSGGSSSGREKNNIFCCLFAPWAIAQQQQQQIQNDDSDSPLVTLVKQDSSGSISLSPSIQEAALDEEEAKQDAINAAAASAAASTTPPLPMPSTIEKKNEKLSPGGVTFATSVSPQATHPHMLSVDSTSTALSSTTCTDDVGFDEKKQDESEFAKSSSLLQEEDDGDRKKKKEQEDSTPPPIKGILKVRRCSNIILNAKDKKATDNTRDNNKNKDASTPGAPSPNKRHLFPTYEPKKSQTPNDLTEIKCITFNPMARVLTIPSRKDIPLHQKAQVWWQRCDYDEFKKTGRIISKAMECGGSEIWLASSNAWGNRSAKQQQQRNSHSSSPRSVTSSSDGSTEKSDLEKSEDEYQKALSKYINADKKEGSSGSSASDTDANVNAAGDGDKWWCKFGHSRRGLEHIVSSDEGKARQQSVLLAVRMVMEEQKRQRASRTKDPNKLRNVSMQYTSWARDLALAGGAADAEAVASGFNPHAASRAHHFAKHLKAVNTSNALNTAGDLNGSCKAVAAAVTSQILDANTHATTTPRTEKKKQAKSLGDITATNESMAHRAKGYMPGGGGNNVSAAAVMSGMGYQTVKV